MKIARLYYKRDTARELDRFYIRRVPDSKTIGIAICHDDSQYDHLKSHLRDCWTLASENRGRQYDSYRDSKLSIISLNVNSLDRQANPDALDKIYTYLRHVCYTGMDTTKIGDVIRAYSKWYVAPVSMIDHIIDNNEPTRYRNPVETVDGIYTMFYIVAGSNSYWEGNSIDGEFVSQRLRDSMRCCEDCDYVEYDEDTENMIYVDRMDYSVCDDCYSDRYTTCTACGEGDHLDNMFYSENRDAYYCEDCGRPNDNGRIHEYNYTPSSLYFYDYKGSEIVKVDNPSDVNLPFYGAELEVECLGGSKGDLADNISNYGGDYEKYAYCKGDGSLNDGFEVCFMPMTFHAIKNFGFYEAVLKYRGRSRLQSYNTSTCGMHIHINRESFTDHHLFKFISFVHEFKSLIYLISQRKKVGELNTYARFNNGWKDRAKKSMVGSIKEKKQTIATNYAIEGNDSILKKPVKLHSTAFFGDKYVPINLQHRDTIEVRIFKGNLLEVSFRKNFEFVDSLYYFTRDNPIYKLRVKEFINYCTNDKKRYPNLNMFLANNTDRLQDILRFPLEVPEGLTY